MNPVSYGLFSFFLLVKRGGKEVRFVSWGEITQRERERERESEKGEKERQTLLNPSLLRFVHDELLKFFFVLVR